MAHVFQSDSCSASKVRTEKSAANRNKRAAGRRAGGEKFGAQLLVRFGAACSAAGVFTRSKAKAAAPRYVERARGRS